MHRRPFSYAFHVQEILADIVSSSATAPAAIGTLTLSEGIAGHAAGSNGSSEGHQRKRQRIQMKLTVDPERIQAVVGKEQAGNVPSRYEVTLEDPLGARILTRARPPSASATTTAAAASSAQPAGQGSSAGPASAAAGAAPLSKRTALASTSGFTLSGVACYSGAARPDTRDPAYSRYVGWRRRNEAARAAAGKRTSTLARADDVSASQGRARAEALALLAASHGTGSGGGSGGGAGGKGSSGHMAGGLPKAGSVLEAFEKAPVWSVKQLVESTGLPESSVRECCSRYCDYLRSGPHTGRWVLKQEFRTAQTPVVPATAVPGGLE